MQKFTIPEKHNNKKIIQVITNLYPDLSLSVLYKALRQKDIRINGIKINNDTKIYTGDYVELYISDNLLFNDKALAPSNIVYDDANIIIINKPQGLKVQPDNDTSSVSLIELLKNMYNSDIALCHRLDRNTGGLIISGKDKESVSIITGKIKTNEILKIYRVRIHGKPEYSHKVLNAYHMKNTRESLVYIYDTPVSGSSKITTEYDLIKYDPVTDTSVADIKLVTGKTHQIRAHMAHIGYPVVGDGKYGSNEIKKRLGEKHKYQSLFAYKLIFDFKTPAGKLDYLKNEIIEIVPPI